MAIIKRNKKYQDENNNIFWTTLADLMLGLAIIFIAMFVLAMTGFTQNSLLQQKNKLDVTEQIEKQLKEQNVNAQINKLTGNISIPAAALFEVNSSVLSAEGKKLLDELAPIYVNAVFGDKNLSEDVEHIAFQGYSDSQTFAGLKTKDEQFLTNMDLSFKRANAVAEYVLTKTHYNKKYSDDLRKKIVVEGNSYNNPIIVNGKEDYTKSRRVELKLVVKNIDAATLLRTKND